LTSSPCDDDGCCGFLLGHAAWLVDRIAAFVALTGLGLFSLVRAVYTVTPFGFCGHRSQPFWLRFGFGA
jgi:hypothetical protein